MKVANRILNGGKNRGGYRRTFWLRKTFKYYGRVQDRLIGENVYRYKVLERRGGLEGKFSPLHSVRSAMDKSTQKLCYC